MEFIAERYDKDILVVETGYPLTLDDPANCVNVVEEAEDLPHPRSYPPTPEGQAAYFDGLREIIEHVPDGHGLGYFVWEPAWLPDVVLNDNACNRYAGSTLFDWYGSALPALDRLTDDDP